MDHSSFDRPRAAHFLIGILAALCLTVPVVAGPAQSSQEKKAAARVAKKVERAAKAAARQTREESEAVRHFQKAAAKYAQLHASLLARLGDQKAVTAQALANAITANRAKAKPGDILLPEIQPLFRRLIAEQLTGPDALAARQAVSEGNPAREEDSVQVVVRINASYPQGASRSTVPPSVLLSLPPLPACLHYRFVGRDLILVDSVAQIIVDFLKTTAPPLVTK